jgi:hypothetical protein
MTERKLELTRMRFARDHVQPKNELSTKMRDFINEMETDMKSLELKINQKK